MKHNHSSTLRRVLSAILFLLASVFSWAYHFLSYDFKVGGIGYSINEDGTSVTVASGPHACSGAIVIHSKVVHEGKTYRVTGIGSRAFWDFWGEGFSSLTSVSLPSSVTSIGGCAFDDCTSLASVDIPSNVKYIGDGAFAGCSSLTSVPLPKSLTSIGDCVFKGCTSLASVDIPSKVKSIGGEAFRGCTSLTSIDIPFSVTSIGDGAFAGCSSLASVSISKGLTSIGDRIFSGCTSLTSMTVAAGNNVYDSRGGCNAIIDTKSNRLVAGCRSTVIPSSVTSIGVRAFAGCSSLTSIVIPSSVTSIGAFAFDGCSSLTSIDIPSSVTSIGGRAFDGCSFLTSIDIPSSVTSIGAFAFDGCIYLTSVICRAEKVPKANSLFAYTGATLYVPASAIEAYKAAAGWKDFKAILPLEDYKTGAAHPGRPAGQ